MFNIICITVMWYTKCKYDFIHSLLLTTYSPGSFFSLRKYWLIGTYIRNCVRAGIIDKVRSRDCIGLEAPYIPIFIIFEARLLILMISSPCCGWRHGGPASFRIAEPRLIPSEYSIGWLRTAYFIINSAKLHGNVTILAETTPGSYDSRLESSKIRQDGCGFKGGSYV